MTKKVYAFLLMGEKLSPEKDIAVFETDSSISYILTVNSLEGALEALPGLVEKGIGAIELCGGFKEEGARKIIEKTGGKVAVGYVVHFPQQDPLFESFFDESY